MRVESEFSSLDLHALLGVPEGATAEQIRFAYRLRARASHPDLHPNDPDAGKNMALLNRAVHVLLDPALHAAYERARRSTSSKAPRSPARSWYERANSAGVDWGSESPAQAAQVTPGQRAFRRHVRHVGSEAAARAQEALRRLGNEQRLLLAAVCIALGSGLLVLAHPSNAFWTSADTALIAKATNVP
jgi:curved DNA-binding protein CbpA